MSIIILAKFETIPQISDAFRTLAFHKNDGQVKMR